MFIGLFLPDISNRPFPLSAFLSDICTCFFSPTQHEEQTGEQDRRSRTEEVTHGDFAGGSGSAGGELSKDPELSGGKTEGVIGLGSF